MRKFLSHLFVFVVNLQFLGFALGLLLAVGTDQWSRLPVVFVGLAALLPVVLALLYQLTRHSWKFRTIGEQLLGCTSKTDILEQEWGFSVSRVPLLLLMVATLVLNSNLLDGLTEGEGAVYHLGDVVLLVVVLGLQYQGFKSFLENPGMVPIICLAGLLFGYGVLYRQGYRGLASSDLAILSANHVVAVYKGLAVLWMLVGYYYTRRQLVLAD